MNLTTEQRDTANQQLAGYRYGVAEDGHFTRDGIALRPWLEHKRGRWQAMGPHGQLWHGDDCADFVRAFYQAVKL